MDFFNKLLEKKERILIFGRYGQLASTFHKYLGQSSNLLQLSSRDVDFLYPDNIPKIIADFKPKFIINTSAYTDVNGAEKNIDLANKINSKAVGILAEASKINNSILIHYSTDYVFDGKKKSRYKISDLPDPINNYGKSKLEGEKRIIRSNCNFFILRVSWLVSEFSKNFLKTILFKLKENNDLYIINDQYGTPISSELVVKITCKLMLKNFKTKKVLHLSTKGKTSWYDIASYIYLIAENINKNIVINPIGTEAYASEIMRPKNSLFDVSEIETLIKSNMPHWKEDITPLIKKLDI